MRHQHGQQGPHWHSEEDYLSHPRPIEKEALCGWRPAPPEAILQYTEPPFSERWPVTPPPSRAFQQEALNTFVEKSLDQHEHTETISGTPGHTHTMADMPWIACGPLNPSPKDLEVVVEFVDFLRAEAADKLPHSRACGIAQHAHGLACSSDCPTCRKPQSEASGPGIPVEVHRRTQEELEQRMIVKQVEDAATISGLRTQFSELWSDYTAAKEALASERESRRVQDSRMADYVDKLVQERCTSGALRRQLGELADAVLSHCDVDHGALGCGKAMALADRVKSGKPT